MKITKKKVKNYKKNLNSQISAQAFEPWVEQHLKAGEAFECPLGGVFWMFYVFPPFSIFSHIFIQNFNFIPILVIIAQCRNAPNTYLPELKSKFEQLELNHDGRNPRK